MIISDKNNQYEQYGVVIDAGSSGSRIHIYQWDSPEHVAKSQQEESDNTSLLKSVPQIRQNKDWTYKISPGLSSFAKHPKNAYVKHIKQLLDFSSDIIPKNKISETPIFIQATAGMRLLSEKKQKSILEELCKSIKSDTEYLLKDCSAQIQIIDGETEGLYGWLSLNYLLGNFNDFDSQIPRHASSGFMDMGGASTQLAFMPSDPDEITKHKNDIHTIYLKNVNGDLQEWDVFVDSWLGFGANKARSRYLVQLINLLPENTNNDDDDDYKTRTINDPCLPKGAKTEFEFKDKDFNIIGVGDYEHCIKSIYPLLMTHLPCAEEPCLFNGVHAPKINFEEDRFVGISEYWYTANDVFKVGGEYNFHEFSKNIKEFCESDWETLKENNEKGLYNNIPDQILLDSCFKANWVLNILHEGFDLPRIDIDIPDTGEDDDRHIPFQSADSINDQDLSWTLGRILMYASGLVLAGDTATTVGIMPSSQNKERLGKEFIPGAIASLQKSAIGTSYGFSFGGFLMRIFVLLLLLIAFFSLYLIFVKSPLLRQFTKHKLADGINIIQHKLSGIKNYKNVSRSEDSLGKLEEGMMNRGRFDHPERESSNFRSRSMMNLRDSAGERESHPMNDRNSTSPSNQGMKPVFSMADFSKFKTNNRD